VALRRVAAEQLEQLGNRGGKRRERERRAEPRRG
jgi:hypothetical protein